MPSSFHLAQKRARRYAKPIRVADSKPVGSKWALIFLLAIFFPLGLLYAITHRFDG